MTIAALKMSKFGPSGMREVGVPLPPRLLPSVGGSSCSSDDSSSRGSSTSKVKTAAERKTYVDVVPSTRRVSTLRLNGTYGCMMVILT